MQVTRTYETDMADLAYQVSRSDVLSTIRDRLRRGDLDDQEAQSQVLDLVLEGECTLQGERGTEGFKWVLSEADAGRLTSILYRDYLGGN